MISSTFKKYMSTYNHILSSMYATFISILAKEVNITIQGKNDKGLGKLFKKRVFYLDIKSSQNVAL